MNWVSDESVLRAIALASAFKTLLPENTDNPLDFESYMSTTLEALNFELKNQKSNYVDLSKLAKNDQQSTNWRKEGNKFFGLIDDLLSLEQALECYTKSIAYATASSRELALGYANRSAVLLKLNRLKECVEDSDRALMQNYPEESRPKLWIRKAEAYEKLAEHSYIEAKYWLEEMPQRDTGRREAEKVLNNYSVSKYGDIIDEERAVPKLKSPSSKYPFASDAIDVKFSGFPKTTIVATRDIEIGEVLVVEKPYSRLTKDDFFYTHCTHCLDSCFGLPCHGCVEVVFCSEKCRELSWEEYHRFECPILGILKQYDALENVERIRSLRILLKMHHEAGGIYNLRKRVVTFLAACKKNDTKAMEKWSKEQGLESVLLLNTNIAAAPKNKVLFALKIALSNLFYLEARTDFFKENNALKARSQQKMTKTLGGNAGVKFIGGLLFRLTLATLSNSWTWNESVEGLKHQRGVLLLPFICLLKFSCYSNCTAQCLKDSYVLHALLPIKKGEELGMPYNMQYMDNPKDTRIEWLKNYKYIICDCIACRNDWPLYDSLPGFEKQAKSKASKEKIIRALKRYQKIDQSYPETDIQDKNKIFEDLKIILKIVHEGVNLPCQELAAVTFALLIFYQKNIKVSKLKKLYTNAPPEK